MPRPPLPLGAYGKIKTWHDGKTWIARAKFRDYDGTVRLVKRSGKTKAAAERGRDQSREGGSAVVSRGRAGCGCRFQESGNTGCVPLDLPAPHQASAGRAARARSGY